MNEIGIIFLTLFAGFLLGVFFFGGLWWTTKKALLSKLPALWFLISLFVRLGITVSVIYVISRDNWQRILICLLGFIIGRIIVIRLTKITANKKNQQKGGYYEIKS